MKEFLSPTFYVDSNNETVIKYALDNTCSSDSKLKQACDLYYAVRDQFTYNPFRIDLRKKSLKASEQLKKKHGYCVQKAILLTAACRSLDIPSSLQFFIVKNHIGTSNFEKSLKTDLIVFHGGSQIFIDNKWVKATPAFDKKLCNKLHVDPLEFNGKEDSIFQQYMRNDSKENKFMEYVKDYGVFADFPSTLAMQELRHYYPHVFNDNIPMKERTIFSQWD